MNLTNIDCIDCSNYQRDPARCRACVSEGERTDTFFPMFAAKTIPIAKAPVDLTKLAVAYKADEEKPRMGLLPAEAIEEIAKVLTFGANKYEDFNWRKGEGFRYSRVMSACMRHLFAWLRREDNDPETGLSHIAHAACCLLFLLTYERTKTGVDDRYAAPEKVPATSRG